MIVFLGLVLLLTSLLMIVLVLLHKGKGGGLSDMFGGGASSSVGGSAVAERNKMLYVEPSGGAEEIFTRGYDYLFFAQPSTSLDLPAQVQAIAHSVFTQGFVDAMHPTMVLPILVLVLAASAVLFVRGRKPAALTIHEEEAAVA